MSEKPKIHECLAAVMADVQAVRKGDRNQQQGYAFRGIDATINAVGPVLRKHGVVCVPMLQKVSYRDVQTSTGKASRECTVEVLYRFHGPAGDHIDCITPGESMDFGDKGAPKAMSVAYRVALLQALCIPTDEPDPDHDSYERGTVGRGEPPRDTINAARSALGKAMKAAGYERSAVEAKYEELNGVPLTVEDEPAKVREFTAKLAEHMS